MCRAVLILLGLVITAPVDTTAQQSSKPAAPCRAAGSSVRIPELAEASGIAISRRVPGRLWALNDSGAPTLYALDARGSVTGRVKLTGATVEDWEAIAVGPCPAGSCLYVADIGDNNARRRQITVYRVPEPGEALEAASEAEVFHATYPDRPQDAEALLVGSDGRLYVITKGETGPIAVYRFPGDLRSGASVPLERLGAMTASKTGAASRITDGAISPDGRWVVLRTRSALAFYRADDLLGGTWREASRVDLTPLGEPQGEGIALGAGNTVFVVGEGGTKGQGGTFASFNCEPKE